MRGRITITRASLALLCCLAYLSIPQPLFGQAAGSITGQVRIYPGNLVSTPVMVTITGSGAVVKSSYSDGEGRFGVNGLSPGEYHVVVKEEGYQPADETVRIDSVTSSTMALVTIYLRPVEKKADQNAPKDGNPHLTNPVEYLQHVPKPARKEFDKGVSADEQGKFDAAIGHYQKALELAPEFYPARNNLGTDFLNKAQYQEAREQFEKVVQANPSEAKAYFNLGNLFLLTKQYDLSGQWLEKGLSRQPDSALGHFLQGSLYARQGKGDAAEAALKRCLELDHLMSKAHLALVNLYLQEQRKDEAIGELRVFLKDSPGDPLAPKAREVLAKLGGQPVQ